MPMVAAPICTFSRTSYRFYGVGNDQNELGISLDILQEMPLYFASGTYRVWKKLYVGLGYMGGTVDTSAKAHG